MHEFRDRRAGLIVFGIIQVLIGCLCALLIPVMVAGMAAMAALRPGGQVQAMVPALAVYGIGAVGAIWLGVGSILARRWARALTLVLSWFWLACGVAALAFFLSCMNGMYAGMAEQGQMPPAALAAAKVVSLAMLLVIYIVVPGIFVLFYGSPHVRATCEARDPRPRWTDRCPLPVLGLVVVLTLGALFMPALGAYHWVVPFFGRIVSGGPGAAAVGVTVVALLALARGAYRLRGWAWWGTLALWTLWGVSSALTFTGATMTEFYLRMGMAADQVALIERMGIWQGHRFAIYMLIWFGAAAGYMLWVRRHFTGRTGGTQA